MTFTKNQLIRVVLLFFLVGFVVPIQAQLMNHYWSQSYNSISSLLSGAVVAGDAGNASIFYNPANIAEIEEGSNISLAASFLTNNYYNIKNAMGEGKDLTTINFYVQPQFFSVGVKLPFHNWSFEIAVFNRVKEQVNFDFSETRKINFNENDILDNKIISHYTYNNYYSDNWIGLGGAYEVSDKFHLGISLNFSISSLNYSLINIVGVYPLNGDSTIVGNNRSVLLAENVSSENVKFTNSRMIARIGAAYDLGKWRFGLNLSLPPLNIITTGKLAQRTYKEVYVDETNEGESLINYFIFDSQKDDLIKANYKLPFSIAFGTLFKLANNKRIYSTVEYFVGISPYKMIDAKINTDITTDEIYQHLENKDWLSYAYGASPVLNIAFGYRWQIKPKVLFLMGLRTDFNNIRGYDYGELNSYVKINTSELNIYYATGGVKFQYKRHQLLAGTQMSFGMEKNVKQIANFGPDYEPDEGNKMPLLGVREDISNVYHFTISLFIGATFNFESRKKNYHK